MLPGGDAAMAHLSLKVPEIGESLDDEIEKGRGSSICTLTNIMYILFKQCKVCILIFFCKKSWLVQYSH